MKKALISPNEPRETGYRVAEVCAVVFQVAPPLFWVNCADDVVADEYWYDPTNQTIRPIPQPEPSPNQPTTAGAQTL
jgi:hypothetical protein